MEAAANPLRSLSDRFPLSALRGASIAARLFGALLLAAVALDQSYDPTQVFVLVTGALVLVTLAPVPGERGDWLAGFGSGVVFFAGAVLTHLATGAGLLAMGLLAGLAGFAAASREGRDNVLPAVAFVAASIVTALIQVVIVFSFE